MAHIKRINFSTVGRKEGCTCDRCGQYIRNIWTVDYTEGFTIHYGTECFDKVWKDGTLSQFGEKKLREILRNIKDYYKLLDLYVSGKRNADNDEAYKNEMAVRRYDGRDEIPYEEYRDNLISFYIPAWIENQEKKLEQFKNINFNEEV